MKKTIALILCTLFIFSLCACSDVEIKDAPAAAPTASVSAEDTSAPVEIADDAVTEIVLEGSTASFTGRGVTIDGSVITISAGGAYSVSGKLDNGRILVNTGETAVNVTLTLNGADITCFYASAIEVINAKKLHIVLAEGTENSVVSGDSQNAAAADDSATGAAIYSSDDLKISGTGSLKVGGYINNGIASKNDLKISEGTVSVYAVNNGIRGNDSVVIENGIVSVEALNDGIKSTAIAKEGKGYITVEDGMITVIAAGDGFSAATDLTVNGGSFNITTTGNTAIVSSKAVKAGNSITVNGGELTASTTGKAISCPGSVIINDGVFNLTSKDDAIASDINVTVNGGIFTIISSNDGIKSGVKGGTTGSVTISGGEFSISASLDPIDAKGEVNLTGGSLAASGNSKSIKNMTSSLPVATFNFTNQIAKGREVVISSTDTDFTASMTPMFGYKLIVYISSDLVSGNTYSAVSGNTTVTATAK